MKIVDVKLRKVDGKILVDVVLDNNEVIPRVFDADSKVTEEVIYKTVHDWEDCIIEQYESGNGYGLLFYACGYDGQSQ